MEGPASVDFLAKYIVKNITPLPQTHTPPPLCPSFPCGKLTVAKAACKVFCEPLMEQKCSRNLEFFNQMIMSQISQFRYSSPYLGTTINLCHIVG